MSTEWNGKDYVECARCRWVGPDDQLLFLNGLDDIPCECPDCGHADDFYDPDEEELEKLKAEGYFNND